MLSECSFLRLFVLILFWANLGKISGFLAQKDTTFYYLSGAVSSRGVWKNNGPDGLWVNYFEDGRVKSKVNWKTGKLDGQAQFFTQKGLLLKTIMYKNNIKNGYTVLYDSLARIYKKLPYERDTLNGKGYTYFPAGAIESEFYYKDGKLQGNLSLFAEDDGRVLQVKKYEKDSLLATENQNRFDEAGKKQGFWKDVVNGKLVGEGNYLDGQKNGEYRKYDDYGNLIAIEKYHLGQIEPKETIHTVLEIRKTYYPNGKIETSGGYKDNQKIGAFSYFDSSGNYMYSEMYKKDTLVAKGKILESGDYDSLCWFI